MELVRIAPAVSTQPQLHIEGDVILPGDIAYDEARQAWNLSVDQYPAMIVFAKSAYDILEAVRFAQREGLGIAVQATGHGVARLADNALLINTSQMNHVSVDAEKATAWVEGGAKWQVVLDAAQAVGLAPLLGSSPDVGAVGYTLGGGMGWLARKYGLSADSVLWFELVTTDGRLLRVSASENADLFWGLRGGGAGSLGIVTGMEIKLYPVTTIFGGNLIYPASLAREIFARFREWVKSHPDELTASVSLMNMPPIPEVPEFLRGQSVVFVRGAYAGPVEEGAALIQPWLDWKEPIANLWGPMPFSNVGKISNEPIDPTPALSSAAWVHELTDEAIDTILEYTLPAGGPPALIFSEVRHAGGVMARVGQDANAYSNRESRFVLQMVGITPTREAHEALKQHIAEYKRELQPALTGKVYINFLEGEERRERTQDAFSAETYRRLQQIKAEYDPKNRMDYGFDITPEKQGQ